MRFAFPIRLAAAAALALTLSTPVLPVNASSTTSSAHADTETKAAGRKLIGYFIEWGVYARDYHAKNLDTSGTAAKLTHINYAFGEVVGGKCAVGDDYAAYQKQYDAAHSVDGVADTGPLYGNFNQLRKLKAKHPGLKILYSFGGWSGSGGFSDAAKHAQAFAESCYNLLQDSRWAGVFDGIDIDWEYPDNPADYKNLMSALRAKFGQSRLVTAAISGDGTAGGKIETAGYADAAQYVDWYNVMTYDYFGPFDSTSGHGPTAPHAPLYNYPGIPRKDFNGSAAIDKLLSLHVPAGKLLLGIPFYGRGWTGVTQKAPGGTATGPARGTWDTTTNTGVEDYKVLKTACPFFSGNPNSGGGSIAGTIYAYCSPNWWSYDAPESIDGKTIYIKQKSLGGAFFWEASGDTSDGELATALHTGLQ
ncbi:glycoside hydrolase family 18 protein [Streptosporangium sp. NPDC001559]|uniref:glycoside hydrolase family 18 protein n=1 Tax=Streptosporangium sp. NPDC001559 TaxID=3366187 RepID=UPI0036EB8E47